MRVLAATGLGFREMAPAATGLLRQEVEYVDNFLACACSARRAKIIVTQNTAEP
jgi:hypothetical protein